MSGFDEWFNSLPNKIKDPNMAISGQAKKLLALTAWEFGESVAIGRTKAACVKAVDKLPKSYGGKLPDLTVFVKQEDATQAINDAEVI
jgi:hypothetical protein